MKKFYGTIEKSEKQADGTMIVMGFASSESKDVDGEVIKADAIKGAIPDYMKFANVREMHKADKASGTVLEMEVQADGRTWVKTHIVDSEACKKVAHNVYKGFSIGGRVTERDETDKTIIKGIKLSEISLVDRPANPDSIFTFAKVDAGEGDGAGAGVDATTPTEEAKDGKKPEDGAAANAGAEGQGGTPASSATSAETATSENTAPVEGAGKEAAAGKGDDLKKGMYAVSRLASILSDINYITTDAEYEAASEGDGSMLPAGLKAWLKQGGELLKDMVTEEVAELTGADDVVVVEVIALADKAKNLMKAACTAEEAEKFAKGLDALTASRKDLIAKAGKRNSAADQKHLDAIHDAACAMGAACDTSKAHGKGDDLHKAAGLVDSIAKALGAEKGDDLVAKVAELVDVANVLGAQLKKFEAMPKPGKAILKVVEKGGDASLTDKTAAEDDEKPKDGIEALKKVYRAGGKVE